MASKTFISRSFRNRKKIDPDNIYYIVFILQMSCMQKILHLETYSELVATAPFMLGHGLLCFALHKM